MDVGRELVNSNDRFAYAIEVLPAYIKGFVDMGVIETPIAGAVLVT